MATLLLVDDDAAIREVLRAYLTHSGFTLLEAEDGLSALEQAPQADVVILDLMLPGLSGLEVAQTLRAERPDLPILMLSAKAAEDERDFNKAEVHGLQCFADGSPNSQSLAETGFES